MRNQVADIWQSPKLLMRGREFRRLRRAAGMSLDELSRESGFLQVELRNFEQAEEIELERADMFRLVYALGATPSMGVLWGGHE